MTRKPRKTGVPRCAVRAFILRRIKEIGSNLGEFSAALGKNDSYAQQLVWRGTPKFIDRPMRERMAPLLGVHPDNLIISDSGDVARWEHPVRDETLAPEVRDRLLEEIRALSLETITKRAQAEQEPQRPAVALMVRGSQPAQGSLATTPCVVGKPAQPAAPRSLPAELAAAVAPHGFAIMGDVPQFTDADEIEPPEGGWRDRPVGMALGGASFALIITQPRGRLRADVVLVRASQHPRIGDMVVVLEGKRVAAVGEMVGLTSSEARVTQGDHAEGDATVFPRAGVQLFKVAAAEFA